MGSTRGRALVARRLFRVVRRALPRARRNDPATAPLALLSQRERQVAALVAMGHANKVIGYELGIATSTVGVLVGRALARLGLHSRKEVGAAYLAQTGKARPQP